MREELERVKARLRENREFAAITVSREGQNLTGWTSLTATEIAEAVREARFVLSGQRGSTGKKIYRNEEAGFEVDMPEGWSLPTGGTQDGVKCLPDEAIDDPSDAVNRFNLANLDAVRGHQPQPSPVQAPGAAVPGHATCHRSAHGPQHGESDISSTIVKRSVMMDAMSHT